MSVAPAPELADLQTCLQEAQAGSDIAVHQLFERSRNYLLYIATRELSDDLRAKLGASDIVQECLIKAHRKLPQFQGKTESELLGWLRQILIRSFLDAYRRYKATGRRGIDQEFGMESASRLACSTDTPSVELITNENEEAMQRALQELPDHYRQVIQQRLWERKSFNDIALAMNRSPEAVRKLWFRGVDQLRRIWQERHDEFTID